jgi:cytochrome oxidase Cu insertion factor (SCO1/SenC/PrrC family)
MKWKRVWVAFLCVCFSVLLVDDVFAQDQQKQKRERRKPRWRWKGPEIGTVIQDFELPTLDGKKFKLSDNRGKIVIIELGACT